MRFSFEDQQDIASLRIDLHQKSHPKAIELADAFNKDLDEFQRRFTSAFVDPDIDVMFIELEKLKELAHERNGETLQLLRDRVLICQQRAEVHSRIQTYLNASAKSAREELQKVFESLKAEMGHNFSDNLKLEQAVKNTDAWKAAHDIERFHHGNVSSINVGQNVPVETARRLEKQSFVVLHNWLMSFLERRTREVDPNLSQVEEHNERMLESIERSKSQPGHGKTSVRLDGDKPSQTDDAT